MTACGCPKGKVKRCVKPSPVSNFCVYGFSRKKGRCLRRTERSSKWLAVHRPGRSG